MLTSSGSSASRSRRASSGRDMVGARRVNVESRSKRPGRTVVHVMELCTPWRHVHRTAGSVRFPSPVATPRPPHRLPLLPFVSLPSRSLSRAARAGVLAALAAAVLACDSSSGPGDPFATALGATVQGELTGDDTLVYHLDVKRDEL